MITSEGRGALQRIIIYFLWEVRENVPGGVELMVANIARVREGFRDPNLVEEFLRENNSRVSQVTTSMAYRYANLCSNKPAGANAKFLNPKELYERKVKKLAVAKDVILIVKEVQGHLKNNVAYDKMCDDILLMMRLVYATLAYPRQWDEHQNPMDLDPIRHYGKLVLSLEIHLTYWKLTTDMSPGVEEILTRGPPWAEFFNNMGDTIRGPVIDWTLDDIFTATRVLRTALRRGQIRLDSHADVLGFEKYRTAILYRICEMGLFPIAKSPAQISQSRPGLFELLRTGADGKYIFDMDNLKTAISEEVRKHIQAHNEKIMISTFGKDYKEKMKEAASDNDRMKSKEDRTADAMEMFLLAQKEALSKDIAIHRRSVVATMNGRRLEELDDDEREDIEEMVREEQRAMQEIQTIKSTIDATAREAKARKDERLKRLFETLGEDDEEEEEDLDADTGEYSSVKGTGLRDLNFTFDMIRMAWSGHEYFRSTPPSPRIPGGMVSQAVTTLYTTLLHAVQSVDEINLLNKAHQWVLSHVMVTPEQTINYMLNRNKNKKVRPHEVWKYFNPGKIDGEYTSRIPQWKESIVQLMSPGENNPHYYDVCAFACDFWLQQEFGKTLMADSSVFLWDFEFRMLDLKLPVLHPPYICRLGNQYGIFLSFDNIYPVGPECLHAVIWWLWEISKADWKVMNRITNTVVSLKSTKIYTLFKGMFERSRAVVEAEEERVETGAY